MSKLQEEIVAATQDGRDDLDLIIADLFLESNNILTIPTRITFSNIDLRVESTLDEIIETKIQTKGLPLALRKRLMYQRAATS